MTNVFSLNSSHTLGTGFSVVAIDTLSVVKDRVEDGPGNKPKAGLTFSVPSVCGFSSGWDYTYYAK